MKIAVPILDGHLCSHFGQARQFAVIEADAKEKRVQSSLTLDAPEHQPGVLPKWLASQGVNLVIVGGMGMRAQELFREAGVKFVFGAPEETPEKLVEDYLEGVLQTGKNVCEH